MNGRFLLDTNIIIALFAKDPKIHDRMANAEEIFVSCIAIGEMYFGAYKSLKIQENISRIDEFVLKNTVLSYNTETAKIYGDIKKRLKDKGQPIPENDIWLAAIAQQYGLILVTKDSHFDAIENLKIEKW
ncbi:MAG: type II toxin-antitoxin system VapC family toxin [Planctomycetia bacterium]|nr:MAG: type II toxin-antitoxin system VapC family toxin [Planctomycetia bacterium]TVL96829.1 MAG: VapC toxin family PIN domain ribonuclease [Candidatus Brocadia sp. BL1]HQU32309.1 type II toxin-antitoxin system VapC family toxin [Candidatus Brocadia sapporoensis]